MQIKSKNEEFINNFITDKYGKRLENPIFEFKGQRAYTIDEALNLLGDKYEIHLMDVHESNLKLITIHAYLMEIPADKGD